MLFICQRREFELESITSSCRLRSLHKKISSCSSCMISNGTGRFRGRLTFVELPVLLDFAVIAAAKGLFFEVAIVTVDQNKILGRAAFYLVQIYFIKIQNFLVFGGKLRFLVLEKCTFPAVMFKLSIRISEYSP